MKYDGYVFRHKTKSELKVFKWAEDGYTVYDYEDGKLGVWQGGNFSEEDIDNWNIKDFYVRIKPKYIWI